MDLKSDKRTLKDQNGLTVVTVKLLEIINNNANIIVGAIAGIMLASILSELPPTPPKQQYDCSKLEQSKQQTLTETINNRLALIKPAMNKSLSAGANERSDMQKTIQQIMADTRKEYCTPIKIIPDA